MAHFEKEIVLEFERIQLEYLKVSIRQLLFIKTSDFFVCLCVLFHKKKSLAYTLFIYDGN